MYITALINKPSLMKMKKTVIYLFGISLLAMSLTNCKSSKKGCGLTSDTHKIEQLSTVQTVLVSEVK